MLNVKNKFREISFYFSTQIILIAVPLIYIPLISSVLNPKEFGKTSIFLMILSFSSQLFYGPISNGVNKFYYLASENLKLNVLFKSLESILLKISGMIFLIILILYKFSRVLEDFSFNEILLLYFVIVLFGVYIVYNGILGVQRQRSKQMTLEIIINISKLGSLFLFFKFILKSNISVILASLLSLMIAFIVLKIQFNYSFKKINCSIYHLKFFTFKILKFAIPFTLWAPFLNGYFLSDRFLIKHYFDLTDLGNYSIQYQITFSSMQLLSALLSGFLLPILLENSYLKNTINNKYKILLYTSFGFIFLGFIGGVFLYKYGEIILHFFLKSDYFITPEYLLILTFAGTLYGASQILAIKQTIESKNTRLLYCNITLSLLGILSNFFSIKFFGINGLVYSVLLLSSLWYFTILFLFKLK